MTYAEKLLDLRWLQKRQEVILFDGGRCRDCGDSDRLQVHHCFYLRGREPWDYPDGLLMTLCDLCHRRRQQLEEAAHLAFAVFLRSLAAEDLEDEAWGWLARKAELEAVNQ